MTAPRFALALAVALPAAMLAQRTWTPQDAVALALEQNGTLTAASARVAVAEGLRLQAGLRPNPRLFLQSENTRFGGSPSFKYGQDTDNLLYASQALEAKGKRQSRVQFASENVRANELSSNLQRAQVAARVLAAYWTAVGAQRMMAVLSESLQVLGQTVQYHRDRVREGSLPEADLIRVQLEFQQVSLTRQNAEQDARRAVLQLYREIGIPEEPGAKLSGDLADVPSLDGASAMALERRPDWKLAVQNVQIAQAGTRLQQVNAKSDPEVLLGYKRTAGFNTLIAGVQFNLPVRNKNQGAIAAAVAEERAATALLGATRMAAANEIQALQGEYEQKRQVVEQLLPPLRAQAAETNRIAEAVYREGASDLLRLLDAERVRLQTEMLYIRILQDYRQAAVNLQIALGLIP